MVRQKKKNKLAGFFAAFLLHLSSRKKHQITGQDLKQAEFKTDTGAIGVKFNENIRRVFRKNWLRKKTK